MDIGDLTDGDWNAIKKIDKADKLIFMIPENGLMPYQSINHFYDMKTKPLFFPYADSEITIISFIIGTQVSGLMNGKCYIISAANFLFALDGFIFTQDKQCVEIKIFDTLENAVADKKGGSARKNKSTTASAIGTVSLGVNVDSDIVLEEEMTKIDNTSEDDVVVSMEFRNLLQLYSTPGVNLLKYATVLYESVQNTTEGVLSTFEFQLKMRLGEDIAVLVYPLLENHIEELKKVS